MSDQHLNSGHLNSEQVSEWLIGERPAERIAHVARCSECATEIAKLETPLANFRSAVLNSAVRVPRVDWQSARAQSSVWSFGVRWAVAGALAMSLAMALLVIPMYRNHVEQVKVRQMEMAKQSAKEDAALMAMVEREILEPIPQPMQPLTKLVSYTPPASKAAESEVKQ